MGRRFPTALAGILLALHSAGLLTAETIDPYPLINPLTRYFQFRELKPFRERVEELISNVQRQDASIANVTVYFRSLTDGIWFGINEKEKFIPASLLKVPVLMAVLKRAQSEPSVLAEKAVCRYPPTPVSPPELRPGKTVSIDQLLSYMIRYSDNVSLRMLADRFQPDIVRTYADLGIPLVTDSEAAFFSIKDIARFLRVLYNSSYLDKEMSQKALDLLTQCTFKDGIAGGLPPGIVVANKYGSRLLEKNRITEIHECGIVYYPGNPYIFGISVRMEGVRDQKLAYRRIVELIRRFSVLVYSQVDTQYREIVPSYDIQE